MDKNVDQKPLKIVVILLAVLILDSVVVLHSLWAQEPFVPLLWLWCAVTLSLRQDSQQRAVFLAFGAVVGETIAYFMAVPWPLFHCCLSRSLYGMPTIAFLRFFALLLVIIAFQFRWEERHNWRWMPGISMALLGFLTILPFGLIARGPNRGTVRLAEDKARQQLGPDYKDYDFYLRYMNQVFRPGESVLIKTTFLAFQSKLVDVQEVNVSWKESWTGSSH